MAQNSALHAWQRTCLPWSSIGTCSFLPHVGHDPTKRMDLVIGLLPCLPEKSCAPENPKRGAGGATAIKGPDYCGVFSLCQCLSVVFSTCGFLLVACAGWDMGAKTGRDQGGWDPRCPGGAV